jgi:predicted DsbA family dithiol-disulfide isomerase
MSMNILSKNLDTVMKIDIWSDVRCPFCYIGKRKFEKALERFPHKDNVEVTWHSFQLDPSLKTQTEKSPYDYFVEAKGVSREQAIKMHDHAAQVAKETGLDFNFEKTVVANSFNAHRLIQLAKIMGVANAAEEQLFKAHFTDGKNIDDKETLVQIGVSVGIDKNKVDEMLSSDAFATEVKQDELAAQAIGIRGVPFFVFNNKYAVSGAQSPETFLQTLEESWKEFEQEKSSLVTVDGESCSADGTCD